MYVCKNEQDGNGTIDRSELRHVMMNIGEKMSEEECDSLVNVNNFHYNCIADTHDLYE